MSLDDLNDLPLGKSTVYIDCYNPDLLRVIPRIENRMLLGLENNSLPFKGVDIWNAYELSWLDLSGKPVVAAAEIRLPCESLNIIESKSLKLYFNSFNQSHFKDKESVLTAIQKDISERIGEQVELKFFDEDWQREFKKFPGKCLDSINSEFSEYHVNSALLKNTGDTQLIDETVYSHLLKSNCPITHRPDWASVLIAYQGLPIDHESLLKYIISYRKHDEFHEQSVERVFMDILNRCKPKKLSVYARYVRRGGIDINPYRSNFDDLLQELWQFRQ